MGWNKLEQGGMEIDSQYDVVWWFFDSYLYKDTKGQTNLQDIRGFCLKNTEKMLPADDVWMQKIIIVPNVV